MSFAPTFSPLDLRAGPGAGALERVRKLASLEIAAVTNRLARTFVIGSQFAPALAIVGGEIILGDLEAAAFGATRASITGNGESVEMALVSCLAEGAEFLSQFERPGDVWAIKSNGEPERAAIVSGWISDLIAHAGQPLQWVCARDAATGCQALLPADLCLRRPPTPHSVAFPRPLSAGVAAGPNFEAAAGRAILELCERDAAAFWWLGGKPARGFPADHQASRGAIAITERLRRGITTRTGWILDITTDIGIPVVAAVSLDQDGRGLACGLAARLDVVEAVNAAVLEMCQMELAAPLAAVKCAEAGEGALNEADRRHLRRAAALAADCALLRPVGVSPLQPLASTNRQLDELVRRLTNQGITIYLLDLTRTDIGVSVVRAVSPSLQPFTATVSAERFRQAGNQLAEGGKQGVPLM